MNSGPDIRIRKYIKYTHLIREDIRKIMQRFGLKPEKIRICDFGCGSGITTFALSLELDKSICIELDKFSGDFQYSLDEIRKLENHLCNYCSNNLMNKLRIGEKTAIDLCQLMADNRLPSFIRGDIVTGSNLPRDIGLAFCQRIFINIKKGKQGKKRAEQENLLRAIENIVNSLSDGGYLLSIEFAKFELIPSLKECGLEIIEYFDFNRHDVRSRGRTNVLSHYTAYLCQK
ncbi:MAG: hypothetical protein ACFFE8_16035 [Candidatus Heimdallarchaeota archaeon]